MEWLLSLLPVLVRRLVMPPTGLFLLGLAGLVLRRRGHPRMGAALMGGAAGVLLLLCVPWVASALTMGLQTEPWLRPGRVPAEAGAIVVLGADVQGYSPELGRPDVGPMTLTRLRYGATLARESGLPLALSGGATVAGVPPIARLMHRVLREEHGIEARFVEDRSLTTWDNAALTAPLLRAAGIEHVVLVSHAWHLPRARAAFERAGLRVTSAPTAALGWPDGLLRGCQPSGSALRSSCHAVHEWVGRAWYALRARLS